MGISSLYLESDNRFLIYKVLHSYQMTVRKPGPASGPSFFIPLASVITPGKRQFRFGDLEKKASFTGYGGRE